MKTLIIHPKDVTTDFLIPIYDGIEDKTVMRQGTVERVIEQIKKHKRIIMMGHGCPSGLFGVGQFTQTRYCTMSKDNKATVRCTYVIDRNTVELLRTKQCIFIWCNADKFVLEHDLKGFYSGMFISETWEARAHGINADSKTIETSNDYFAAVVSEVINKSLSKIHQHTVSRYGVLAETSLVAEYNCSRLYYKKTGSKKATVTEDVWDTKKRQSLKEFLKSENKLAPI